LPYDSGTQTIRNQGGRLGVTPRQVVNGVVSGSR